MSAGAARAGAIVPLPLAAGGALLIASWLPVRFEYRPNELGIVSLTTLERYPIQQETFWALFGGVAAGLLALALSRALASARPGPRSLAGAEALAAAALLAVLWLPALAAPVGFALAAAGALWLARQPGEMPEAASAARRPRAGAWALAGVAGAFGLGALLAPGLWENLWSVANGIPDERHVANHFKFLTETGQHLFWADALARGELHGRDFFCLYGPLYDLGIVGLWKLVGRSIAGAELYFSLTRVLGWTALLALGMALLRRPALALLLPLLLPWVKLRMGLPLFALLFLLLWMRGGPRVWCALAGAAAGAALLYSQEFGLAVVLCIPLALALRRDARGALIFAAGLAVVVAPLLIGYAAAGALGPMLGDLVGYPSYMLRGFGKLPFPGLVPALPLDPFPPLDAPALELRLAYATAAVCVAGVLLLLPVGAFDPRRPLASLRAMGEALARDPERLALLLVALFGVVAFRSALGRSQLARTLVVLPPAALLLVCGLDRSLDLLKRGGALRWLAGWRMAALLGWVVYAGFPQTASPIASLQSSIGGIAALWSGEFRPVGNALVMRVTRWIQLHTQPDEPVLFMPNDAAYYYLTQRPNPIRFAVGHQMVTDAHRAEALESLRRSPPRYVVWDHGVLKVDGIDDEPVYGPELLAWIRRHYTTERHFGEVEILAPRSARAP